MSKPKKNILVTGSTGQVGQELKTIAEQFPEWNFIFASKSELDITDESTVKSFFKQHHLDYCVNCAAYTAVDKAETEAEKAWLVNSRGIFHLAKSCAHHQCRLLHLSTDYVYHTAQNTPFRETDPVQPRSIYAKTKLEGDLNALSTHPNGTIVIRTSWVYSAFGHNFVKTMLRLGREREKLNVVFDQIGTPTYARDLAFALLHIIQKLDQIPEANFPGGIYHYSNEGVASWYDFAVAIFELSTIQVEVSPILSVQYLTPAPRPPFSVLNKDKIKSTFALKIPHWRISLENCLQQLDELRKN